MFTIVKYVLGLFCLCCAAAVVAQDKDIPSHPYGPSPVMTDRYLVVFKSTVVDPGREAEALMRGQGGQIHRVYNNALKGFAATIPAQALEGIRRHPQVDWVEEDRTVQLNQLTSPQNQATWGLDRIDQRDRPLDTLYHFNGTGAGVSAFVIDTGIRPDHVEFSGRVLPGYSVITDGNGTDDCHGHGTHVSGTLGGSIYGVAKSVKFIPVRVLNCSGSGTLSGVVAGVDWAAGTSVRPAVANLSLGSSYSATVNAAIAGAVAKGLVVVVAAGNSSSDACYFSPSSEPSAITVGATTSSDSRASYSNTGTCVDLFAPGSNVKSAWNTSSTATATLNGTSMASPHVAGVAALALQAAPTASPGAVTRFIVENATANRLTSQGAGSPNLLVYSLAEGAPGNVTPQTVAVKSLSGSAVKTKKNWTATVTITVRDVNAGTSVQNARVAGSFSPGGAVSCVTGLTGSCSVSSAKLSPGTSLTTYTVQGVTGADLLYDASQNSATQLMVVKP